MAGLDNGFGAWLSHEGPNLHALQCLVPHPTGQFDAEEILEQVKRTHDFEGNVTVLYSKRTEKAGLFIRFAVNADLLAGLQFVNFKPFCLITRLNIFNSRDQARNKAKAHEASLRACALENAVEEDIVMSEKASDVE